jgi:hypothetical protein
MLRMRVVRAAMLTRGPLCLWSSLAPALPKYMYMLRKPVVQRQEGLYFQCWHQFIRHLCVNWLIYTIRHREYANLFHQRLKKTLNFRYVQPLVGYVFPITVASIWEHQFVLLCDCTQVQFIYPPGESTVGLVPPRKLPDVLN